MKINDSNKRYPYIIAGILVLSVLPIFVAFALGVGDYKIFSDKGVPPVIAGMPIILENNNSEDLSENIPKTSPGNGDVSVDQGILDEDHTVEPGQIILDEDNIPDELPICITPSWGEDKWVVFKVLGGYTPQEFFGMLKISQQGTKFLNPCDLGMWVGWGLVVTDSWEECPANGGDPCDACWVYYNVSFDTDCDNYICLDSSYDPNGDQYQKNKDVTFTYDTLWYGCEFGYIPAHENHNPGISNSRKNI